MNFDNNREPRTKIDHKVHKFYSVFFIAREAVVMRTQLFLILGILATGIFITACADNSDPGVQLDLAQSVGALEPGTPGADCDENGAAVQCYTGAEGSAGIGACKFGTQFCIGGKYTDCKGEVTPTDEVCDGADNNCDGVADEGLGQTTCGVGQCETTVDNCAAGAPTDCELAAFLKATPEVCDGVDNSCEGLVDEDQAGNPLTQACYNGADGTQDVGECKGGTQTCTDGELSACVGEVTPTTDVCDTLDNDCDSATDEDFPNLGEVCTVGQGECEASDVFVCNATKNGEVCNATPGDPVDETCDTKDNDCDGDVDEDADGNALTQACYTGADGTQDVGECKGGNQTCVDGAFDNCTGEVVPTAETCDSKDNDCDNATDEGDDGKALQVACYTGTDGTSGTGACSDGVQVCALGELTACLGDTPDVTEVCFDLADNDCDGDVDENCTVPCTDDDNDGYGEGCAKGADCDDSNASVNPAEPEWCGNATDDDCDSLTDEIGCFPTTAGSVLVRFEATGACSFGDLFLVEDFSNISSPPVKLFTPENGFSTTVLYTASSGGLAGLHRFNLEFDVDGSLGNDLMYVDSDASGPVLHDECGSLRFFFEGTEVPFDPFLDPRPVTAPFDTSNAFVCFGPTDGCFLCGGDYDNNGTADCDEDGGYCALDPQDNAACGS